MDKKFILSVVLGIFLFTNFVSAGTDITSLNTACSAGDINQIACTAVNTAISATPTPNGTSLSCIWNNPGAAHNCSLRVNLDTSIITNVMLQSPLIKSMEFIQSGSPANSVIFYSDPFVPHYVHVIVNGSLFPLSSDPEFWMRVTGIADITPNAFSFDSITPAEMAAAEKAKLEAQYLGHGNITLGEGMAPDLSLIKSFQNFTWNLTISYDTGKNLAGAAECNGTVSGNSCSGNWSPLPECTTPGNCQKGTYIKDFPSVGLLTVYGADPVPVYGTAAVTTLPVVHYVNITPDFLFVPANITITVDDIVNWTNLDINMHRIVDDNMALFDSGDLMQGNSYSFQFNNSGVIPYHCQIHPTMKGTITVSVTTTILPGILINEFQPNPNGTDAGNEWVELYNNGSSAVNLTGWTLETVALSEIIESHGFKQVIFPTLTLTNTGDTILLKYGNTTVDRVVYGVVTGETSVVSSPDSGQSAGRSPDGSSNWTIFTMPTPGAANSATCTLKGDKDCDGRVDDFELLDYISNWVMGNVTDFDLLEAINNWAKG